MVRAPVPLKIRAAQADTAREEAHQPTTLHDLVDSTRVGGAPVSSDPIPDNRPGLHPRLTVAPGAGAAAARDVPVLTASDLADAASAVAAERSAERIAVRARLDAATARAVHDLEAATSRLAERRAAHQALLDAADWAVASDAALPGHAEAIESARRLFEARRSEQRAARARLDLVLEQRSAAAVAMQDADEQVGDLDGIGMDEMGLRRELEAAGDAARDAHAAHAAAVAEVQRLADELDSCNRRAGQLRELVGGGSLGEVVPPDQVDRVRDALAEWVRAARGGGVDNYSQALADAFTDLLADLAELEAVSGPAADAATLSAAQAAFERAAAELRRVETAAETDGLDPSARAELDAAHAAVERAAERTGRRFGRGSAQRQLEEAEAHERALLDRHGFSSHLEVVLSGGRSGRHRRDRTAAEAAILAARPPPPAEAAFLAARAELDRLCASAQGSPELDHLHSERSRLLAHVVDRLGVDPGDRVVALLRAHPNLPGIVVEELRQALEAVGVQPVGVGLADAATEWLADQDGNHEVDRAERAETARLEGELRSVADRARQVTSELAAARAAEAGAVEQLELATRSVGAVEAELTTRAGEDSTRFQRYVAAQQLRTQVEALAATLTHAEGEARALFDTSTSAVEAAEVTLDRAQGAVEEIVARARALAEDLPPDQRPVGERLTTLVELAERLRERAELARPSIDEAEADIATASGRVDAAIEAAEAAGTGLDGPRPEDVTTALERLLERAGGDVVVLDDPFAAIEATQRAALCDLVAARSGSSPLVLLTDDRDLLGWAIGLPADVATVVSADSILNLFPLRAETKGTEPTVTESTEGPNARLSVGHH